MSILRNYIALFFVLFITASISFSAGPQLTSHKEMMAALEVIKDKDGIKVSSIGESVEGKDLPLVHFPATQEKSTRVLLIGLQHGDEHAGKEALLQLIDEVSKGSYKIPAKVDLWIVPMANPDGNDADQRRNSNDFDLNRDHIIISQTETRALHELAAELKPDVIVDCHEFRRDTGSYTKQGWLEWPLIMMDTANSPHLPNEVFEIGKEWVARCEPAMRKAGFNYMRYHVGSAPGSGEMRYSTLECDDARNGLALYGGLSFIIESGIWRDTADPQHNLAERVAAYRLLLEQLLNQASTQLDEIRSIRAAWEQTPPPWFCSNVFWGNTQLTVTPVRVIDANTSETLIVETPNFMTERVLKSHVPRPIAYVISEEFSKPFKTLLEGHSIPYTVLDDTTEIAVERSTLQRFEDEWDAIYSRYDGRQIVERGKPEPRIFAKGALYVKMDGPKARRVAAVLEPNQLFGIWEWPEWRELIPSDGVLPVWRVVD
jgi:hypothetical protein